MTAAAEGGDMASNDLGQQAKGFTSEVVHSANAADKAAGKLDEALELVLSLHAQGCAALTAESVFVMMEDGMKRKDVDACEMWRCSTARTTASSRRTSRPGP
jgi:hypothetical protein